MYIYIYYTHTDKLYSTISQLPSHVSGFGPFLQSWLPAAQPSPVGWPKRKQLQGLRFSSCFNVSVKHATYVLLFIYHYIFIYNYIYYHVLDLDFMINMDNVSNWSY